MYYKWAGTADEISEGMVRGVKRVLKEKTMKKGGLNNIWEFRMATNETKEQEEPGEQKGEFWVSKVLIYMKMITEMRQADIQLVKLHRGN